MNINNISYRPDIDGLRAVAVLSVILFHLFPEKLPGGFIGVDIFFVISGYLISSIIFKELYNSKFSFTNFYIRRIKRIFPALTITLIFCMIIGWFILFAWEYEQLGKHVLASTAFVQNFVLWSEVNYFDNSAETKPLLHIWSLAIEEQFYIFYPFALWFAWKNKFNTFKILVSIFIISFVTNQIFIYINQQFVFYSPITRTWELLAGGILAHFSFHKKINIKHKHANFLSFAGFAYIITGLYKIDGEFVYPNLMAIMPVFGTVLLILAGKNGLFNKYVLSAKPVIWIGLISYPMYLWHWPIISFHRILNGHTQSISAKTAIFAATVIFSWMTYYFLENRIRVDINNSKKAVILTSVMVVLAVLGSLINLNSGVKDRNFVQNNFTLQSQIDGHHQNLIASACGAPEKETSKIFNVCQQDKRGNIKYALIGDSKAQALWSGLVRTSTEKGRWVFMGGTHFKHGSPAPLLSEYKEYESHQKTLKNALKIINSNKDLKLVAFASATRAIFKINDFSGKGNSKTYDYNYMRHLENNLLFNKAYNAMKNTIAELIRNGKKVIIIHDNPALPKPEDCMKRTTGNRIIDLFITSEKAECRISLKKYKRQIKKYTELLEKLKNDFPDDLKIFDPTLILCNEKKGLCEHVKNGRLLYSYTDHISDYGAGLVGKELNKFINEKYN